METPRKSSEENSSTAGPSPHLLSYWNNQAKSERKYIGRKLWVTFWLWAILFGAVPFYFGWGDRIKNPAIDVTSSIATFEAAIGGMLLMRPMEIYRQIGSQRFIVSHRVTCFCALIYVAIFFLVSRNGYLISEKFIVAPCFLWGVVFPCVVPWIALRKERLPAPSS